MKKEDDDVDFIESLGLRTFYVPGMGAAPRAD